MKKRAVVILLSAILALSVLTGCSGVSNDTVIVTVGDTEMKADVANFYLRYTQAQWETYYSTYFGEDMWITEASEGETYEEYVKKSVLTQLEQMIVLKDHMDEYDVEITDDEKKSISEAAEQFMDENGEDVEEKVSASKETIEEVLTLLTIQEKMNTAIGDTADTEVSDDDAAQKSMDYVMFSFTNTDDEGNQTDLTDDEKEELKTKASEFQKNAKDASDFKAYAEEAGYEIQTATFDSEAAEPNEDLVAAADALAEGGVTDVVETDTGCFVAKVTSLFDEEATNAKKESIISERKEAKYNEVVDEWIKDAGTDVNTKAWNKLDFTKLSVTVYQDPEEAADDSTTGGAVMDDGTTNDTAADDGTADDATTDDSAADGTSTDDDSADDSAADNAASDEAAE